MITPALIFDMDGVLVDTEPIYFAANNHIFNQLGFSVNHAGYARFIGLDAHRMWSQLKAEQNLPQSVDALVKMEKAGMVSGLLAADLSPMAGLSDLLAELASRGVALALASSSSHRVIEIILRKLGFAHTFAAIASGEDVTHGKPAPDIFLLAAQRLGAAPATCTVIEDSANGVRGAKAAGMRCVGFRNPGSGAQDLSEADVIIDGFTPAGIREIIGLAGFPGSITAP